ncbi:MAG TPA: TetR/AcrR family transcriptional regulator [Steroidobacteraceae bacterium]
MQERILSTADRLFYSQGIRAIGVDTVAAEIGISKRTLYNYFPSKDALVTAYLRRRYVVPKPSDEAPLDQILAAFDRMERWFANENFRGCAFVNAVTELGDGATQIAIDFKEQRRQWFKELLTRLNALDPDSLATQLAILVEGAMSAALVRRDPALARAAKTAATVLMAAAGVRECEKNKPVMARKPLTRRS